MAGLLDRLVLIVLPVVTLLFPLFGWIMPMFERQRRARIARWYGALRAAEHRSANAEGPGLETEIARVRDIRRRVAELRDTPVLHLGELYHLLMHIDRALEGLERRRAALASESATPRVVARRP